MEIPSNNINQPVSFFTKNTGNTINMAIDDNRFYQSNIFSPELNEQLLNNKKNVKPAFKKRKSKRLNTMDSEFIADFAGTEDVLSQENGNFFVSSASKLKKASEYMLVKIPLLNYFYLKKKRNDLQKTVELLNGISQNVDDLLNTISPYGEEKELYSSYEKNLSDAANAIGKAVKGL